MGSQDCCGEIMDQAVITFRSVAYDILRQHYDNPNIPKSVLETIPMGKTYDSFTDEAIARQITQMLYIIGKWFEMFESENDNAPEKLIEATMQVFGEMFLEACKADEKSY